MGAQALASAVVVDWLAIGKEVVGPLFAQNSLLCDFHPANLGAQNVKLDVDKQLLQNGRHTLRAGLLSEGL